ncbi:MAG: response regulator [Nitrosopumilus sp.]|nr:response regulator [Nitrosopumilus sp.]
MNRTDITNEIGKAKNILIVDDDTLNLKLIDSYLKELGFNNISVASNGIDAITKLQMKFDLILLDIGLPDINGIELCRQIRKLPYGKNVPIIAISAYENEVKEKCIAANMNCYIRKPLTFIKLKNIISEYIQLN